MNLGSLPWVWQYFVHWNDVGVICAKSDLENMSKIDIQGFQSKSFHQIRAKLDVQNFQSKSLQHIGTETNFQKFRRECEWVQNIMLKTLIWNQFKIKSELLGNSKSAGGLGDSETGSPEFHDKTAGENRPLWLDQWEASLAPCRPMGGGEVR